MKKKYLVEFSKEHRLFFKQECTFTEEEMKIIKNKGEIPFDLLEREIAFHEYEDIPGIFEDFEINGEIIGHKNKKVFDRFNVYKIYSWLEKDSDNEPDLYSNIQLFISYNHPFKGKSNGTKFNPYVCVNRSDDEFYENEKNATFFPLEDMIIESLEYQIDMDHLSKKRVASVCEWLENLSASIKKRYE